MAEYLKRVSEPGQDGPDDVPGTVSRMLERIEIEGPEAIRSYSRELDGFSPDRFEVSEEEIEVATRQVPAELRKHITFAQGEIRAFAEAQLEVVGDLEVEPAPGIVLGHRNIPLGSVGAYVPGGRYPMLASAFMTVLVAKTAGVKRVVACSPPSAINGIDPATIYSMHTSGADRIIALGGVQALAAMAFGFEDIEPVDMLVGPGNAYVAEAKRQLFGKVGIDLIAGPTEVLLISHGSSSAELVAADLLGQSEHGPTSPAILITLDEAHARAVMSAIDRLLENWPTAAVAGEAWRARGEAIVARDREEAAEIADRYAPEHLQVHAPGDELDFYLDRLENYGSLFLGEHTTVAYGDKAVGTNHVLPTGRAARYTGGLWVGKFLKTCTYQRLTADGGNRVGDAVAAISEAEGFGGHALTAMMRMGRR